MLWVFKRPYSGTAHLATITDNNNVIFRDFNVCIEFHFVQLVLKLSDWVKWTFSKELRKTIPH